MYYTPDSNTALLVIDVQKGLDDPRFGERNNPHAEEKISRILSFWRSNKRPVIHIQHCSVEPSSPLRPDQPGVEFKPEAAPLPGELIFQKSVHSAFIGTNLEAHLRSEQVDNVVIIGLTTDQCVSTTTRMAGNLGFNVLLISDATATFGRIGPDGKEYSAETIFSVNLASLHDEFCKVITTEELLSA